jgi:hypothetical protein
MPFKPQIFLENAASRVESPVREQLAQACQAYASLTTPQQKAHSIQAMMEALDRQVSAEACGEIMEACGRRCIGASTLQKARSLQQEARHLDDLLDRLNSAHIGGGHLRREGQLILGVYDRCYCGSVSQARQPISATYCRCSCGWYRQLFETLLGCPVQVDLLGSILQGDESCRFVIHIPLLNV